MPFQHYMVSLELPLSFCTALTTSKRACMQRHQCAAGLHHCYITHHQCSLRSRKPAGLCRRQIQAAQALLGSESPRTRRMFLRLRTRTSGWFDNLPQWKNKSWREKQRRGARWWQRKRQKETCYACVDVNMKDTKNNDAHDYRARYHCAYK